MSIELPVASRPDIVVEPEHTHFSDAFPSNSSNLECIKMGTTKPRCIKFRHSLRCFDVLVIFVFKTNSTFQRYKYPMLWCYRMRYSWIKRNKLAPNKHLINEKAKIDRNFKKITYPSGWHHGWSRNAKRDRQVHAAFLKQNNVFIPCARWHVFLFSINVNKNENTNHFR